MRVWRCTQGIVGLGLYCTDGKGDSYFLATTALKTIASPVSLRFEWKEMYRSSKPSLRRNRDGNGESFESFNASVSQRVGQIANQLILHDYKFSLLTPFFAPKPNGKERLICVPTIQDRLVQRTIYRHLSKGKYSFDNAISYGFISGKSTKCALGAALRERKKFAWVYKADISSFFDSIDRDLLKEKLRAKVRLQTLHSILDSVINTEVNLSNPSDRKKIRELGIRNGRGLRQGMPLSPYLSNLFLWDFDHFLIKKGIRAIRYADDIIAFGSSQAECLDIHDICSKAIAGLGLHIHPIEPGGKTEIYAPDTTAEFLGQGIARSDHEYYLTVNKPQVENIKSRISQYGDFKFLSEKRITIGKLIQKLDAMIGGYSEVYSDCQNVDKVIQAIQDHRVVVLSKLFSKMGIDVSKLTKDQKAFLDIPK